MRLRAGASAVALLVLVAAAGERLTDPTRAFVEGFDPSGNDFLGPASSKMGRHLSAWR